MRRLSLAVLRTLAAPAAKRGTLAAEIGSVGAAIVFGVVYWWVRTHH